MSTTGTCSAMRAPASTTACTVAPAASARVPAAWMTGPSASGSENGTPSSSRSAPASAHASPIATDASTSGKPPIRYGISAARPGAARKAAAMRAEPAPLPIPYAEPRERLGEVLVPPAGQADEVELRRFLRARAERPGDRVGGLQRGDDPLQLGDAAEGGERLLVGRRDVARAARVAQPRVLGAAARVVEAGGDRVRLEDLAVPVLHERGERAVQPPAPPTGGQRRAVAAAVEPLAARLDADQRHLAVADERREDPDRVRAAAD